MNRLFDKAVTVLFGTRNYQKFIVLCCSRTGSNWLLSLLRCHPDIDVKGEAFARTKGKSCRSIWDSLFTKKLPRIKWVGFKIFYYHPLDSDDCEVWTLLKSDPNIRIIHLNRDNTLRTIVSRRIALKVDKWTIRNEQEDAAPDDKKVELSANECMEELNKIKGWERKAGEDFKEHRMLRISYEQLVDDQQKVLDEIFDFLEIGSLKVTTDLKKQNKENLEDLILNYQQLSSELVGTKWEYLLKS